MPISLPDSSIAAKREVRLQEVEQWLMITLMMDAYALIEMTT